MFAISRGLVLFSSAGRRLGPRDLLGAVTKRPEDQIPLRVRWPGKERPAKERIDVLPDDFPFLGNFEETAEGGFSDQRCRSPDVPLLVLAVSKRERSRRA